MYKISIINNLNCKKNNHSTRNYFLKTNNSFNFFKSSEKKNFADAL